MLGVGGTHLMKMFPAPLCRVFSRVSIKNAKEALALDTAEIVHERMCVFHRPTPTFVPILGNAYSKRYSARFARRARAETGCVHACQSDALRVWVLIQCLEMIGVRASDGGSAIIPGLVETLESRSERSKRRCALTPWVFEP